MALPKTDEEMTFTYQDYLSWPVEERWELIDGFAYNMSPAPSRRHQQISRELVHAFLNYLADKTCQVYFAPFDVRLPEGDEADEEIQTVVQPDIVIVCDSAKLDDRGCRGAPDLVIEITSPTTAAKDVKTKMALYERHGVKEYWIVEPEAKIVIVFRLGKNLAYGRPDVYSQEDKIKTAILPELEIDLGQVFTE